MTLVIQNASSPGEILFALLSLADDRVVGFRAAVAYVTYRGCETLLPRLERRLGSRRWRDMPKTVACALDFGISEPAALERLANVPRCEVRVAGAEGLRAGNLIPRVTYHPKLYMFDKDRYHAALVGSANLTENALSVNTEAALLEPRLENALATSAWSRLVDGTTLLDERLLAAYVRLRKRERPRPPVAELPLPEVPVPGDLTSFPNAVERGQLDPADFDHLWVEAGAMSSGGSHNQLELPRGANRFFGFGFDEYGEDHVTIGHPVLMVSDRVWDDRPLTWHGNNKMERINLPTPAQGGYDYRHTAILFSRRGRRFEIEVAPWDSTLAKSWRNASAARGRLYKLGELSNRVCGVF
jgi:NgoFVII-like restriction endonuclease